MSELSLFLLLVSIIKLLLGDRHQSDLHIGKHDVDVIEFHHDLWVITIVGTFIADNVFVIEKTDAIHIFFE